jgi:hypothetical protein
MTVHQKRAQAFRAGNIMVAEIVAGDPVKYPPDSLLGQWAALVLSRAGMTPVGVTEPASATFNPEASA